MGYGGPVREAGETIGKTGDEGIGGIIKEDKLGLDVIYVQAKRWQTDSKVIRICIITKQEVIHTYCVASMRKAYVVVLPS